MKEQDWNLTTLGYKFVKIVVSDTRSCRYHMSDNELINDIIKLEGSGSLEFIKQSVELEFNDEDPNIRTVTVEWEFK